MTPKPRAPLATVYAVRRNPHGDFWSRAGWTDVARASLFISSALAVEVSAELRQSASVVPIELHIVEAPRRRKGARP